jgi:hypothetical protein
MLNFFKALVDTRTLKLNGTGDTTGLHTYYVTEFGQIEGERLYRQFKLDQGER